MELTATDKIINQFEARIKELLRQGLSITEAVQRAYKEFPVMETLRDEVESQIVAEASAGYGSALPSSTVAALTEAWAPDGLTLSKRTTKGRAGVLNTVINVLRDSRRRGESYKKTALNLFDGYKKGGIIPQQDIPKFMSELFQLSAKEGYKELAYRAQLRRVQYALQRLKTPALRSAYSLLVKAIDARNDQAFSKAIYSATQERTRYFAERIARTELRRAYIDGFLAKYQDDPTVLAYRWRMSSAHPVFDICDVHANADLHGLGKGIYPKDKVPMLPAHPHCLCYLMPVRDLQGKTETEQVEQGGREYLDTLSTRDRQRLLGIHGEKAVKAGTSWTAKLRGYSGNVLEGRIAIVPDVLKPYIKDGKINIEEFGKRLSGETDEAFEKRIWAYIKSDYCTKDFVPRQELHYKFAKEYVDGKSYYQNKIDLKEAVQSLYGGSLVMTGAGNWNKKVKVKHDFMGTVIRKNGQEEVSRQSTVHISNKGFHFVPREEKKHE